MDNAVNQQPDWRVDLDRALDEHSAGNRDWPFKPSAVREALSALDAANERARVAEERADRATWWFGVCDTIAIILGLPLPEADFAQQVRDHDTKRQTELTNLRAQLALAAPLLEAGALSDIAAEVRRQIEVEGWTPEHDDNHSMGELANAAACYASGQMLFRAMDHSPAFLPIWPWAFRWWKAGPRRRNLIKAGALIVAEIKRLDRLALPPRDGGQADG